MIRPNQLITESLGFPYKGDPSLVYRPNQCSAVNKNLEIIANMVQQERRVPGSYPTPVLILHAPTGTGKTLAGVATAVEFIRTQPDASQWQVVYVVSTKLHQDEVTKEFGNFADLRGRNNYQCFDQKRPPGIPSSIPAGSTGAGAGAGAGTVADPMHRPRNCAESAHTCKFAGTLQCNASQSSLQARMEPFVVTNYAMWFAYGMLAGKWPVPADQPIQIDLDTKARVPMYGKLFVVFDEAHDLISELTKALTIELDKHTIHEAFYGDPQLATKLFPWPTSIPEKPRLLRDLKWDYKELEPWVEAAKQAEPVIAAEFAYVKSKVDSGAPLSGKLNKLDKLLTAVRMLSYANPREWVLQVRKVGQNPAVEIKCARMENKIKPLLIQQANVVGLMSATISQCVLGMLGFKVKAVVG